MITPVRSLPRPLLLWAILALASCGTNFVELQPTQPLVASVPGALKVEAHRILVTDDVPWTGMREDTALVVELDVTNTGGSAITVNITSLACLLELDAAAPAQTLTLPLGAGDVGTFPGEVGEDVLQVKPIPLAPGATQRLWALFRGYRYAGSDVPRRVTLTISGPDGRPLRLVLADPAQGTLRWTLPTRKVGVMLGVENLSLLGGTTKATGVGSEITFVRRLGPVLLDYSLSSLLMAQTQGSLLSQTSSFAGSGLNAHLAYPFVTWGPEQDPRRFAVFGGGEANLLISNDPTPPAGQTPMPHVYGAFAVEGGIDLQVGALGPAPGPFPIKTTGTPLPRWFIRAGYTHWFVNGHGADGYISSFRLMW